MGIITTQILGFGQPKPTAEQKADPKPVRGFDYAGQPMKEGEYYNGRPEHMAPFEPTRKVVEPGVGSGGYARSEEVRQATRARSIAQHALARAEQGGVEKQPQKKKRWHWTAEMRQRARERSLARMARQKAEQDLEQMKKATPEQTG